ncbi:hypothetical protein [Gordonia humi]|uniref:Uncharacterized protein n=1 Tax=Gordonia humi TaxID=686429 RepID=A0A840EU71_9ACTN|nr:hypothetical protein [Gordonia humi]MBB4135242.1 hypothetical protein [Gordonia humi]
MFAALITEFADRIVDELAPPTTDELADTEGPGLRLAVRLDRLSRTGIDDAELPTGAAPDQDAADPPPGAMSTT